MATEQILDHEALRAELDKLSDRELLLEVAVNMAIAAQVIGQMQQHPMVKKMMGG